MRPYLLIICLLVGQLALAQSLNFNTATPRYPDRALSHIYPSVGSPATQVDISVGGSGSFQFATPNPSSNGLTLTLNFASNSEARTVTITFSPGVSNLSFGVLGIEKTAQVQDQVTINATTDNMNPATPSISPSTYATVAGNIITGASDDPGSNASGVQFGGFIKRVSISYGSGASAPANPGASGITIGHLTWTAPLPVSLLYFRAQPQPTTADRNNRVTLSWATSWERDADRFEVQRSRSLSEFGTIGHLPARGTTDTRQLYTFSDEWPDSGITYYRLRQVDSDGTATYSNIVAAVLDDSTPTLSVLESDLPGTIRVRGRNLVGAVFSVVSMAGRVIPVRVQTEADGSIRLHGSFVAGLYIIRAEVDQKRLTQRALVEK